MNFRTLVLLQEEDEPEDSRAPQGERVCTPRFAMLGGKVGPHDTHWIETATRELAEETGRRSDGTTLLSAAALEDIMKGFGKKMAKKPPSECAVFTSHVAEERVDCQLIFYPVPPSYASEWQAITPAA